MPEVRREPVPEHGRVVERERVVETPNEARAGVTGHNARYVLAIGTVGVVALFAIVYMIFFA